MEILNKKNLKKREYVPRTYDSKHEASAPQPEEVYKRGVETYHKQIRGLQHRKRPEGVNA